MDRSIIGNLRLASGLILFLFVLGHFINHALGIISLKAMNDWLWLFIQPWRDPVGEFLLVAALVIHIALAVYSLYKRKFRGINWHDLVQLISGFLIPILLAGHILSTRGLHEAFGVVEGYQFTLYGLWISAPVQGVLNTIALPLVWFHACLGWHMWFRLMAWYKPLRLWALSIAIIIPTLALAGYLSASLRVVRLSNSEKWVARLFKKTADQASEFVLFISTYRMTIISGTLLTIAAVFLVRFLIAYGTKRKSGTHIKYRDFSLTLEENIFLTPGSTVLDHIRGAQISHAAVCGGRGRCSTCRVRIDDGQQSLTPPSAHEKAVLNRISAPENVRLACQVKPTEALSVTALLKPDAGVRAALLPTRNTGGEEQEIAVLFADIRAFTKLSETKLPYDTAFLLNRYFAAMGEAIEESGGHLDKFIGDGVMAIFGVDETLEVGCKKALIAARTMSERLEQLNETLGDELNEPLRIGIGIHSGTAIVGNMGYNRAIGLTAIGDVVNTASRLESMTKEFGAQLIVSKRTVESSGLDLPDAQAEQVSIRGRNAKLPIFRMMSAKTIKQQKANA